MFNLIIVIISIALTAVLTIASVSYIGGAFNEGRTQSTKNAVMSQAQQIVAAQDLHYLNRGTKAANVAALVSNNFLASAPTLKQGDNTYAWGIDATNNVIRMGIATESVCASINEVVEYTITETATTLSALTTAMGNLDSNVICGRLPTTLVGAEVATAATTDSVFTVLYR